ncbi:MAG: hypothetical protein EBT55_01350, partial [Proteobacteria bacterium]|nr:hypothetical protein [Pseudomonadota bacterium]
NIPAANCWGYGFCHGFNFNEWVLPYLARFIADFPVCSHSRGIINDDQQSQILIFGFGMPVFGTSYKDAFLDPKNIKPENIAFFIKQLAKICDESKEFSETSLDQLLQLVGEKQFVFYSASAGSSLALSSFLKNKTDEQKTEFFKEVVKELFPQQTNNEELPNKVKSIIEGIVKKAAAFNPPGISYHAGLSRYFDLKEQAYGVGELVKETYFTNMIEACLSRKVYPRHVKSSHSPVVKKDALDKILGNQKKPPPVFSSFCDEAVFPFYYVAMFAKKLKELNYGLDDEQISKFVYKVMQYGDIVEKDGDGFELDRFCKLAIDELKLSDNQHKAKVVSDMAQKYLSIRNSYLALQKEYRQSFQQEYCINILGINDGIKENNEKVRENFCEKANEIFTKEFGDVDATKPLLSIKKPNATGSFAHPGDKDGCPFV